MIHHPERSVEDEQIRAHAREIARGAPEGRMRRWMRRSSYGTLIFVALFLFVYSVLAISKPTEHIEYGMSFSATYARELKLDWREAYVATLDDLGVRRLRLAAHWPTVEPQRDVYDFSELRYMLDEAQTRNAKVIVAVGRRTPRWPECHTPGWAAGLAWDDTKDEILEIVERTVLEFRDHPALETWQVENEPFLDVFADMHCGDDVDEAFLKSEIELVKNLDPNHPVLVTDSGNLGTWYRPYALGDAFGTSVYIYLWNPDVGPFKSILPPSFYRAKRSLVSMIYGHKPTYLIELSIEPWLLEPVVDVPVATQFERMDIDKFDEIVEFARKTHLEKQYLWGAEWWYWLKVTQGHPEFWEKGRELFDSTGEY